uniref:Ovule protein n=1 Tax=Haemonchus placei TaxID=6290 RepID=A0A0N4X138_HAEPC
LPQMSQLSLLPQYDDVGDDGHLHHSGSQGSRLVQLVVMAHHCNSRGGDTSYSVLLKLHTVQRHNSMRNPCVSLCLDF